MNNLIIFDLDGTLADTRADIANAVNLTRAHYDLPILTYEDIITFVGNGAGKLIERAFGDCPDIDTDEATETFKNYYAENLIGDTELYEGIEEGLKTLSGCGNLLAVLSNKPGDLCRELAEHFELNKYFLTVMGGGDSRALKPETSGIDKIIEKAENSGFSRNGSNIWMVGDHYTDLETAQNAGIGSIFCKYGFGDSRGLEPDHIIGSFPEITKIIC